MSLPYWTYNVPLPIRTNSPSVDQPNMTINNASVLGIIGTDHIGFNTSGGGYHNLIHLANQNNLSSFGQLFTKNVTANVTTDNQLFYTSAGGVSTQLTGFASPVVSTNGFTFIPGGVLLMWGKITININANTPQTGSFSFSSLGVNPQNCFVVVPGLNCSTSGNSTNSNTVCFTSITKTGFNWLYNTSQGKTLDFPSFNWIAIGN